MTYFFISFLILYFLVVVGRDINNLIYSVLLKKESEEEK
jgi:hypothetical protein